MPLSKILFFLPLSTALVHFASSFSLNNNLPISVNQGKAWFPSTTYLCGSIADDWQGEVVPEGTIKGCSVQEVGDSKSEWIITIDGVEADLGRFSEAIYKQIISQAKQERFQGFRPGTIPPHLMPTYIAFSMDECARETVLEAMQQNNIRPFTDARSQFTIEQVSIPPVPLKKKKGKKKKNSNQTKRTSTADGNDPLSNDNEEEKEEELVPQWRHFESMDGAIKAGWKPGQSFSFVAKNVKGQRVLSDKDVKDAGPIGRFT